MNFLAGRVFSRGRLLSAATATGLGVALFVAGAVGLSPQFADGDGPSPAGRPLPGVRQAATGTDALAAQITALQQRLRILPSDASGWATLGLAYVQQAKVTADPSYYPKAEEVLRKSLDIEQADNFAAMAGQAALAAARHDFTTALDWAQRAVAVNPYNATLYGTLADALTQLGRYDEAFDAVQRMVDLQPGTPSLARASYTWELRGDTATAQAQMGRALAMEPTPADVAFTRYYLSELALNSGDPAQALTHAEQGLRADPGYCALYQAKARAELALGRTQDAVADYRTAIARVPQPEYVLELGELYQSLGDTTKAREQYDVFGAEQKLFAANGVAADSDATLFEADHGSPAKALALATEGIQTRPFLDMDDAYAWALHVNGRDREALAWSLKATALGSRNPLYAYHQGVIRQALGDVDQARELFTRALAANPAFHPLHAPAARAALTALGAPA
ncbi:tetratricopeptide repeat protein [Yinghuangia aomiensis]|uniref:Tetratricopeptide repeat protein n=1 Tax=Yinghuangia aomiensis TaxID=676205 RepID=A0ABP9I4Y2_9ACTN